MKIQGALLVAAALAVAGPSHAQSPADWDKVIAAAKAEGKVVFYSGLVGSPSTAATAKGFEARYGIKVEALDLRISEIRERLRTEQTSGRYTADVLITSHNVTTSIENTEKSVQPIPNFPSRNKVRPAVAIDNPTGTQVPVYLIKMGYLINTRLVPPAEEPKSWADLTNPKWQGKILADDPRALGGAFSTFAVQHDKLGEDFLKGLAAQKPVLIREIVAGARRVAQGEYAIYMPFLFNFYNQLKGLPVKVVVPSEGVTFVTFVTSMIKNAPHPNAALLFIDYLMSEEAQAIFAQEGLGPTIGGIESKVPEDLRHMVNAKELGFPNWRTEQQQLQRARELYKQ